MATERDSIRWFRRFADVPGVDWETPAGVDRSQLPGHDDVPEISDYDGKSLWWPLREDGRLIEGGSSGSSPAVDHAGYEGAATVAEVIRGLGEALELPGTPSDYHHILAHAPERLWKIRLRDPAALHEAERLCLLDLDFVRLRPEVNLPWGDDDHPPWLGVVDLLYRMYFENGDLAEAEAIATSAVSEFRQERFQRRLDEVRERRAVLESEDAA